MPSFAARIRAARSALELSQEDLAQEAGVHVVTVRKVERNDIVTSDVLSSLQTALERYNVEFLEISGLSGIILPTDHPEPQAMQIRAARAGICMTRDDLAKLAGIGVRSVAKIENGDPSIKTGSVRVCTEVLESVGVQFFVLDDRPVVMLPLSI